MMRDYVWLCLRLINHDYVWLCINIHRSKWLCTTMCNHAYLCMMWAQFFNSTFLSRQGQLTRWRAVRHVIVSGISMCIFFQLYIFSWQIVVSRLDVSYFLYVLCRCFCATHVSTIRCPRSAREASGTSLDLLGTVFDFFWPQIERNKVIEKSMYQPLYKCRMIFWI